MIVVTNKNLTIEDFSEAKKDYKTYIKITLDIETELVALGGEYHVDAEKLLLGKGSKQENIWGGGIDLETKTFETIAMINLRRGNNSTEILDSQKRDKFITLAKRVLKNYVK